MACNGQLTSCEFPLLNTGVGPETEIGGLKELQLQLQMQMPMQMQAEGIGRQLGNAEYNR